MVYKVDGNPQLDSRDWSMYSNIFKPLSTTTTTNFELKQSNLVRWMNCSTNNRFVFSVGAAEFAVNENQAL